MSTWNGRTAGSASIAVSVLMVGVLLPCDGIPGAQSERTLLRVSGRVRHEDLRVETAAQLALQGRPQVSEGRTLGVLGPRLLRLVLLDHDEPVWSLVQRVQFNARFAMDPGNRPLEGRDHLGAVLGDGNGRDDDDNAHVSCLLPSGIIPSLKKSSSGAAGSPRGSLPRTVAALPRRRSGRPGRPRENRPGSGSPARPSCAGPGRSRPGTP